MSLVKLKDHVQFAGVVSDCVTDAWRGPRMGSASQRLLFKVMPAQQTIMLPHWLNNVLRHILPRTMAVARDSPQLEMANGAHGGQALTKSK